MHHQGLYIVLGVLAIVAIAFALDRYRTKHWTPADDERSKAELGMLPKVIVHGAYTTPIELYEALLTHEFIISDQTRKIIMQTTIAPKGTRMRPVITTPEELGFPTGDDDPIPSPAEIVAHAEACGLIKMTAGDAAELRLQWLDQPCDHDPYMDGRNIILAGMDSVLVNGEPKILGLAHSARRLWLLSASAEVSPDSPTYRWYLRRWLFAAPENAKRA